jgi:hypothetical protein
MTKFDMPQSCNSCGKLNSLSNEHYDESYLYSADTKCTACDFEDHWETGFFQSGTEIKSKSNQYWFEKGKFRIGTRKS